jgi:anti-sigma factor RsiW
VSTAPVGGCEREKVTALVDGALAAPEAAAVEAHVASCGSCSALARAERAVHERLRGLPAPELPPGLEARLRARLERSRSPWPALAWQFGLAAAAALVVVLWARGLAPMVAWELSRDHAHCFGSAMPPAQVRSGDPAVVVGWFEDHGTAVPNVPAALDGTSLFGARFCYLPDISVVPHVYYTGAGRPLSLFVLTHGARFADGFTTQSGGRTVALLRLEGRVVGVVGEDPHAVAAAVSHLRGSRLAELQALFDR